MVAVKQHTAKASLSTESTGRPRDVVLRVRGLRKSFGGQGVLKGVDAELHRGEVVLLRGDNGSGKTTLLNLLTGNLEPDAGTVQLYVNGAQEEFQFPRRWWQNLNPFDHFTPERVAREGVGRSWQEVRLFGTQSLRDNIAIAAPDQQGERLVRVLFQRSTVRQDQRRITAEAEAVLAKLGLTGRETSSADMVSLGQAKRVAIARAVNAGGRILFLDEPLAGLDAPGADDVMAMLKELAHNHQLTLVIVEHVFNAARVLDLASSVWTLKDGRVAVETPSNLLLSINNSGRNGINGWITELAGKDDALYRHDLPNGATLLVYGSKESETNHVVLDVQDLVVYRGRRLVIGTQATEGGVNGVSFALRRGQVGILMAPNGWGKTTALEAIMGLIPAARGAVRLNGHEMQKLKPWQRAALGVSFLRSRENEFSGLTVYEALRLSGVKIDETNINHLLSRRMAELSGGERQKVAWLCATARNHAVALLDEPFSALDESGLRNQKDYFLKLRSTGGACLVAVPSGLEGVKNHA